MAYSSSVRLTWQILSITVSVDGPAQERKTYIHMTFNGIHFGHDFKPLHLTRTFSIGRSYGKNH